MFPVIVLIIIVITPHMFFFLRKCGDKMANTRTHAHTHTHKQRLEQPELKLSSQLKFQLYSKY